MDCIIFFLNTSRSMEFSPTPRVDVGVGVFFFFVCACVCMCTGLLRVLTFNMSGLVRTGRCRRCPHRPRQLAKGTNVSLAESLATCLQQPVKMTWPRGVRELWHHTPAAEGAESESFTSTVKTTLSLPLLS